MYIFFNF